MKVNGFVKKIFSKKTLNRINNKIIALGSNYKIKINTFFNIKLLLIFITFIATLFLSNIGYILAPIITVAIYLLYDFILLDLKIKKREKVLEKDAVFFFQVLALTLQSERNLKLCLEITSDAIDSDLSTEFKVALKEVKLGKSLTESLENLKKRIPSKTVNNVILNLIESNVYGNSIVDALNNQVEYITDKRILEIKGQINKLPTKISIVSVLFFIPLIILLILAPVLINYLG